MASTMRFIDTRFWSDVWVRQLNALDRYLFIYLITNSHVSWCGVYELDIAMMAFESGIDQHDLEKTMLPRLSPKIIYEDGWVFVLNFSKYHTGGKNAKIGLDAAIKALPERIRAKIKDISKKKKVKNNPVGGGSPSTFTSTSTLTSASTLIRADKSAGKKAKYTSFGALILKAFEEVDPKNKTYYSNTTQRKAADYLYEEYGMDKVLEAIKVLPETNQIPYFPQIHSPHDLKEKWQKLADKIEQRAKEKVRSTDRIIL